MAINTASDAILLAHKIREAYGIFIKLHSTKGKPEHSLKQAAFPYVLKELNRTYKWFHFFKTYGSKKNKTSDDVALFKRRLNYMLEILYPAYKKSKVDMTIFAEDLIANSLSSIKKVFGHDPFYDDTLSYGEPPVYPDWIKMDSYMEKLILPSQKLDAYVRYQYLRIISDRTGIDIDEFINAWKGNDHLEHELELIRSSYSMSTYDYAIQQFKLAMKGGE